MALPFFSLLELPPLGFSTVIRRHPSTFFFMPCHLRILSWSSICKILSSRKRGIPHYSFLNTLPPYGTRERLLSFLYLFQACRGSLLRLLDPCKWNLNPYRFSEPTTPLVFSPDFLGISRLLLYQLIDDPVRLSFRTPFLPFIFSLHFLEGS